MERQQDEAGLSKGPRAGRCKRHEEKSDEREREREMKKGRDEEEK